MVPAGITKNPNPLLWPECRWIFWSHQPVPKYQSHSGLFLITNVWLITQTCYYHLHFKLPCISLLRPAMCWYLFHFTSLHISVWLLRCLTSSSCSVLFFSLQIPPNLNISSCRTVSSLLTSYSNTCLQGTRIVPQHPSCSYTHSPGEDVAHLVAHTRHSYLCVCSCSWS